MEPAQMLKDWVKTYIKHRDVFEKKIQSIEEKENIVKVAKKDGGLKCVILPLLKTSEVFDYINKKEQIMLVCLNLKENVEFLIKSWQTLAAYPKLKVIFVNPYTREEAKWIIVPHTHNKITTPGNLKPGLMAMFANVEEVDEKILK